MTTLTLSDLRNLFYGGESDEELEFLRDAYAAGVSAYDLIDVIVNGGGGGGTGVTDHGGLTGLTDDDHPQYHNNARGDARYYQLTQDLATQGELDALGVTVAGKETPAGAQTKADAAQAFAIQRANHTGAQAIATVTGLQTALDAKETPAGAQAKADAAQAAAVQRANHTGSQAIATVTGLQAALDAKQAANADLDDLIAKWVPASAAGPASLDLPEDTDNGANRIRVIGQSALAADRTLTLPDETDTLATQGYVTTQTGLLIPKSLGTTKGDLIGFSGANTPVRIPVGTDGKVLQGDSAQASGVSWTFSGKQLVSVSVSAWDNDNPVDGAWGVTFSSAEQDMPGAVLTLPAWYDGSPFYVECRLPVNQSVASRAFQLFLKEGATTIDSQQQMIMAAAFRHDFFLKFPPITLSAGTHTLKFSLKTFTSGVVYLVNNVDIFHARAVVA